jgi:hypothetical protein
MTMHIFRLVITALCGTVAFATSRTELWSGHIGPGGRLALTVLGTLAVLRGWGLLFEQEQPR